MLEVLKVNVGSYAHGLETPESDRDYFICYLARTRDMLVLNPQHFQKGDKLQLPNGDIATHELSRFLYLSTKSNPTILEAYRAPVTLSTEIGEELLKMFPHVWSSKGVRDAYMGYSLDQHKRYLAASEDNHRRFNKAAATRIRMLYNGWEMLTKGDFTIRIVDTPIGETIARFKHGDFERLEYESLAKEWQGKLEDAYVDHSGKHTDFDKVNDFLIKVRKENW